MIWVSFERYNNLEIKYLELLYEKNSIIDSLENDNIFKFNIISNFNNRINLLQLQYDSLLLVKDKLNSEIKAYPNATSLTKEAEILKQNILWEKY